MTTAPKGTRSSRIGCWTAAVGLLLIAVSGTHKLGLTASWQLAFAALALGGLLMLVALLAAGLGLLRSGGAAGAASRPATWLALLAALVVTGINLNGMRSMGGPAIHDITTDLDNPPMFVDAVAVREAAGAANPPTYFAAETAPLQRDAYPDLAPIELAAPPSQAFDRALATAKDMGWEIIAAVPAEGRIEATATTGWIGFKDDVVIRIAVAGDGSRSRVDLRSKSRVGRGDAGMNAKRIRAFRDALAAG
jgi:uncharacterized protein (DUF1499 family)